MTMNIHEGMAKEKGVRRLLAKVNKAVVAVDKPQPKAVVQSHNKSVLRKSVVKTGLDAAIKPEPIIVALPDSINAESGIIEDSDDWNDILRGVEPEECELISEGGARTPPRQMFSTLDIAASMDFFAEKSMQLKFPTLQPLYWG
ncbi:hypothetical protein BC936DRAFT_140114 [Jimgerdemannia flammicorona]|uniref:Uncharacterized protein n=1 Tax=Jimgerdemannia flammicorona TaxID=994334 RepID=A0A433DH57_9FUNG|nr:hypothetical protein BC936DRAFT_140114 [Jimgerdemannia flammicorona]